jgi:hypothetical protein
MTTADSNSVASLLLIRDIERKQRAAGLAPAAEVSPSSSSTVLISEILDVRTRSLLSVDSGGTDYYVASNVLASKAIAMVAEDRELKCVLKELFSEQGQNMLGFFL